MVFSSSTFLFVFLPLVLLGVLLSPRVLRNLFLLLASLMFYAWGELLFVLLMVVSITANYLVGSRIDRALQNGGPMRAWLAIGITVNLGLLGYFKYANFLVDNWNGVMAWLGLPAMELPV